MSAVADDLPGENTLRTRRADRRVALVTGGGSGAGAEIAREFARLGLRVVVSDIDFALAGAVAGEIRDAGGQALAHRCDVASEEQVAMLLQRAQREFGALHFVVNNAGPWLPDDPLEHWSRIVGANLLGTLLVTRQAVEAMKDRGGSIVNIAAEAGLGFGPGQQPAYGAAKAGIVRFTASMAFLQAQHGIRVNCIVPDWIDTRATRDQLAGLADGQREALQVPEQMLLPGTFAAAVVTLALREDCAGRVVLCRAGRPLEAIEYGDPGYHRLEPF